MFLRPTIDLFKRLKSIGAYPQARYGSAASRPRDVVPRVFPTTGFTVIPTSETVEEEHWAWYTPQSFYPVGISDVLQSKYQVLYKLGYGTTATAWMCRDLRSVLLFLTFYT
jgi:hypothetical protein